MRRLLAWAVRSRGVAVGAGLLLVLVPTVFTVFPGLADLPWTLRLLVVVGWLVIALLVTSAAVEQSVQMDDLMSFPLADRDERRAAAGLVAIRAILDQPPVEVAGCQFRLYLFNQETERLCVSYSPGRADEAPTRGWKVGQGATGRCYQTNEYVPVVGPAVSDTSYGLDAEQCERYRDLVAVASYPIRNARRQCIGVLSGSAIDDAAADALTSPAGQDAHIAMSSHIGRMLIDVLRLADD